MSRRWTEHELLIAMNVYCKLPFGKLNHQNTTIIEVAEKMNRTPSSVSMKLCNFASFDPALQARGVKGLTGASRADRAMWDAFHANWNEMTERSELAYTELTGISAEAIDDTDLPDIPPTGPSETVSIATVRRHQRFFRSSILANYESECALTGIRISKLLIASHIIPWSKCEERRTDPTNGICLNVLHDKAFDRGLITFDEDLRVVISKLLKTGNIPELQKTGFVAIEGHSLHLPHRFAPDPAALEQHRQEIFQP